MVPDVFLVSAARWASFTPQQQQLVREAAHASYHRMNMLWDRFDVEMRAESERMGVTFTYPDKAPFMSRAAVLKDEFADDAELDGLIRRIAQS
jgi:TRAP-type C4-dicarboxylate transport system substrate-binding protein